jgi:hypothetical protein
LALAAAVRKPYEPLTLAEVVEENVCLELSAVDFEILKLIWLHVR